MAISSPCKQLTLNGNKEYFVDVLELTVELRIQREWDDDLKDEKSEACRELSFLLEKEVK